MDSTALRLWFLGLKAPSARVAGGGLGFDRSGDERVESYCFIDSKSRHFYALLPVVN